MFSSNMAKPIAATVVEVVEEAPVSPLTIVQNDETREMFADCEPGEEKWVRMRIDTHDDASITATPLEVEYEAEEAEAEPAGAMPKAIGKIAKGGY